MPWVGAALAVAQIGIGVAQEISAKKRLKQLSGKRTDFKTPEEVVEAENFAKQQAQTGFGPQTSAYLTNQNDRSLTSSLTALKQLGGDANDVADLYDKSFQNIFRTGAANEEVQMKKFNQVYTQLGITTQNKEAEWASEQARIKDEMASQYQAAQAGQANISSGLNTGLSSLSQMQTMKLYSTQQAKQNQAAAPIANVQENTDYVQQLMTNGRNSLPKIQAQQTYTPSFQPTPTFPSIRPWYVQTVK